LVAGYGQVIVDECHHLPAVTFEQVLRQVKARYILGLTATPYRGVTVYSQSSSCSVVQ